MCQTDRAIRLRENEDFFIRSLIKRPVATLVRPAVDTHSDTLADRSRLCCSQELFTEYIMRTHHCREWAISVKRRRPPAGPEEHHPPGPWLQFRRLMRQARQAAKANYPDRRTSIAARLPPIPRQKAQNCRPHSSVRGSATGFPLPVHPKR